MFKRGRVLLFPEAGPPMGKEGNLRKAKTGPQSPMILHPRAHQQPEAVEVALSSEGSPVLPSF